MVLFAGPSLAADPLPVIFDTDMDSDCDDVGALAMLHAFADLGEVNILATLVSARHPWSGPCVDAVNTYFGRPDIPIGVPRATPNQQGSRYAETIAKELEHDFPADGERPDAVSVVRRVLAGATLPELSNRMPTAPGVPPAMGTISRLATVSPDRFFFGHLKGLCCLRVSLDADLIHSRRVKLVE
jgi:hypothetical protein